MLAPAALELLEIMDSGQILFWYFYVYIAYIPNSRRGAASSAIFYLFYVPPSVLEEWVMGRNLSYWILTQVLQWVTHTHFTFQAIDCIALIGKFKSNVMHLTIVLFSHLSFLCLHQLITAWTPRGPGSRFSSQSATLHLPSYALWFMRLTCSMTKISWLRPLSPFTV